LDASRSWDQESLESHTEVQLYPTIAYPIDRGTLWRVQVQGRICQNNAPSLAKRLLLRALIRALELDDSTAKSSLFHDRIHGFLVSPLSRERIHVSINDQMYVLPRKSKSSGLFQCRLDLPRRLLESQQQCSIRWDNGVRPISSPVLLAQESGVSVITDIDDTIKHTDVCSRRRMLRLTFAEPFTPIEGMPEIYQQWASKGALFHYVSSSPWQIYDSLQEFLHAQQFPTGSMHLKWFRLRDELIKRFIIRRKSKFGVINNMVKRMPQRHFALVGDSGEKDPEMYAKIASKYPKQIVRICIRQIDANPIDPPRLHRIYKRYGMIVPIQVYSSAKQLGSSPT
jgi:phosphatidate phosphatase APP1